MKDREKIIEALNVINTAQNNLWELHHKIKGHSEELGTKVWEQSLQIEYALKILNHSLFGVNEYWENK